jgi:hypothetical protein
MADAQQTYNVDSLSFDFCKSFAEYRAELQVR